jgi:hypothetical protein
MVLVAAGATFAQGEVLIGTYGTVADPIVVRGFAAGSQGDVPPQRLMGGPATQLTAPSDFFLEETEGALYLSDFMEQAIYVFAAGAQGNTAPLRSIRSALMGQPRDLVVVPSANEVLTIASLCCLAAYDRTANGSVPHLRYVGGGATQLDNPSGLAYRAAGDEVYLGDGNANGGEILVFARTANGGAAPTRVIAGPDTQLGGWVTGLAAHPTLPEIYAFVVVDAAGTQLNRIVTFSASASGNATPLRVIEGDATLMVNGSAFDYDARRDEFAVLVGGWNGQARVLTFPRAGVGDLAPSSILSGPSTGLDNHTALATTPTAPDLIFADGFQP